MSEVNLLKKLAEDFRTLLDKYSRADAEVADFYRKVRPLLDEIEDGKISTPHRYNLRSYFSNPDFSSLAEKYWNHELSEAEARFVKCLEGW